MSTGFVHSLFGLDGQSAVVIGGTGTLGSALALGLAQAGAHVVVAGRSQKRGQSVVRTIADQSGSAEFLPVDANDRQSLATLSDQVVERHGRADMLVNCAGINSAVPYLEIDESQWEAVLRSNLTAVHLACQQFIPHMLRQPDGGAILNIGSVTAHTPLSRVFAYSASKAAVVNLTKNLAREYASQNIRINVLCPGFFPAEQNRAVLDEQRVQNITDGTPMRRFGHPSELIGPALVLLSRKAGSYITGTDMYVDGGFTSCRF
jgi:NAD(P)-dependent dehydrogenase (short-subunit alcohol dehydrogenase family)